MDLVKQRKIRVLQNASKQVKRVSYAFIANRHEAVVLFLDGDEKKFIKAQFDELVVSIIEFTDRVKNG